MLEKPSVGSPCNGCGLCCRIQVCSLGSFTLGLVDRYGDRADGPCPALRPAGDGSFACGLVLRPKDFSPARGGAVHDLRRAAGIMIGAGAGCDEPDGPDDDEKLIAIQQDYLTKVGEPAIEAAVKRWFGL